MNWLQQIIEKIRKIQIPLSAKFAGTFAVLFFITILVVVLAVRMTVVRQFTTQYREQVNASLQSVQQELQTRHTGISEQLHQFAQKLQGDYEFRLQAAILKNIHQQFIVDYAKNYMSAMGLQALAITDAGGTVLSSGHYRNAFGGQSNWLINGIRMSPDSLVLAELSRPTGDFISLVALDSVTMSGQRFYLIGGVEISNKFLQELQPAPNTSLVLSQGDSIAIASNDSVGHVQIEPTDLLESQETVQYVSHRQYTVGGFRLPLFTKDGYSPVTMQMHYPTTELNRLLVGLNRRMYLIAGIGILLAIATVIWRTKQVTQPLERLASTASDLSLETLNVNFTERTNDEIGILNDALQNMVQRLRQNRIKLASAEQKAALADIARQVNHDIKNGFIPIRNVMNHWAEVEEQEPEDLSRVFRDRKNTVFESLDYLEDLTRNYAKLRPDIDRKPVSVNTLLRNLAGSYQHISGQSVDIDMQLTEEEPRVMADEVQLRRAFENILKNAVEAFEESGRIRITSAVEGTKVRLTWEDNGVGIPEEIQDQLFRTAVTTKEDGSGLGLANVKRIIGDFDGNVKIRSDEGEGTTVTVTLPLQT
ncbi:MAG: HAMP domain-containing protein [Candidatus Marinimicrobia bacterium]|nr:HAMP domain-containing protein [Candidatus Neomarinimicrobiota bacterium]MCF7829586.1 HAMP domain-containing protein [Candidatus Neomarinimicrobiota bacterium]MCF7882240.1 HAMP domain-containing protein [Candidatus Neomarinimicrobiota bacterium]